MAVDRQHVVIVGGGFGGLYCACRLRRAPLRVTLLDRRNHHLFQPLLYQVATGGLSPANISAPLRGVLRNQRNATVLLAEVTDFDLAGRCVRMGEDRITFDTLVVAAGMENHYFGNDSWRRHAPGLKSLEDATEMRRRILSAFESAERSARFDEQVQWLTFVVIGAGPTGLELAGTLAEIARDTLPRDFRRINTLKVRILLLDGADRVLPGWAGELSDSARKQAERLGVEVWPKSLVTGISSRGISAVIDGVEQQIAARTVLWAAGVFASPLAMRLAQSAGVQTDRSGRVPVGPDCTLAGHPNVFVIGDMAHQEGPQGRPLPGVAPVAMQQGAFVAKVIAARLTGKTLAPFEYIDKGSMATIGRAAAVADVGGRRLTGYVAWLAWLLVHIFFLIQFQNRVLVMVQWAWSYFTFARSARIITETALTNSENEIQRPGEAAAK